MPDHLVRASSFWIIFTRCWKLRALAARFGGASSMSRAVLAAAWLLLIGSLGSSFAAQRQIGANADAKGGLPETPWVGAALWLLVAGLVLASVTLLF